MATPDTRSSMEIVKQFQWRDSNQLWSNRYHFTGPLTIGLTAFELLSDAIIADEAACLFPTETIVRAIFNDASTATATNPHGLATHDKTVSVAGTLVDSGSVACPGEVASFIRYSTTARTSNNHPIYLFNFYHGVRYDTGVDIDKLAAGQKTALEEYGDDWVAGFSDGTDTRVRCGPRGAVAQVRHVPVYLSHRDFPR